MIAISDLIFGYIEKGQTKEAIFANRIICTDLVSYQIRKVLIFIFARSLSESIDIVMDFLYFISITISIKIRLGGTEIGEFRSSSTDITKKTTLNNIFEVNAQLNAIYLAFQFYIYLHNKLLFDNDRHKLLLPFSIFGQKKKIVR